MGRYFTTIAGLALLAGLCLGCQNKLYDENRALWRQNQELQAENALMSERLKSAPDPAQLQAMRDEVACRDAEIARLQDSLRQQPPGQPADPGQPGLEDIDATYDPKSGNVTVNLPGDVLFAPGDATLKSSARTTLDKIASAIQKNYAGKQVYIDGHTDTDPIRKTKDKWDDNFDLAYARAKAVMDYLTQHGLTDRQIVLRDYGPNKPRGGKATSRRVEIVVATR